MTVIRQRAFLWAALLIKPDVVQQIVDSGRCVMAAEKPDARVAQELKIAPGPPPILSFRYYEGKMHYRFGNMDLMLDDAGH